MVSLSLVGCSPAGGSTGRVDCYSITVGSSSVTYSLTTSSVYEYTNDKGESIYTSFRAQGFYTHPTSTCTIVYYDIAFYLDCSKTDYTLYKFSGLVGYLYEEHNYYLNLDSKTIDQEIKYQKYTGPEKETTLSDKTTVQLNHEKAFSGASKGYFTTTSSTLEISDGQYAVRVYKDYNDSRLERHTYTIVDNTPITYIPKWF
jgi:hypothetical protein